MPFLIFLCIGLMGCQRRTDALQLEKHSQVQPSKDRTHLFVFDSKRLRIVGSRHQVKNVVTYSPPLDVELPLSFAGGETRKFLATTDQVFDVSANPPTEAIKAKVDLWADSPIAVFGEDQSLAYISSTGTLFAKGAKVNVQSAKGVYASSDSDCIYITTEDTLAAYDTGTGMEIKKLLVTSPKNVAVVNGGKDILFAHETNKLSLYDRNLSISRYEVNFNKDQSVWAIDLYDEHLVVVTWEGAALSAKWVARFYDLKTNRELKTLAFTHPIACFVMQGNEVAIVSEGDIRWEPW